MILRVKFNKKNYLRYIGHLDLMRLFHRAFNKSGIKVKYSQGFNPQPKFSIGSPLSLGIESEEEYMDIDLEEKISEEKFIKSLNRVLPKDVQILDAKYMIKDRSLFSIISWALYEIEFLIMEEMKKEEIDKNIHNYLEEKELLILKTRRRGKRKVETLVNIRGLIENIVVNNHKDKKVILEAMLKTGENGNLRPIDLILSLEKESNLPIDMDSIMIKRLKLYGEENREIF